MESGLLNAFHDDKFDHQYDNQFWSNENNTIGLQLSETLHGILPISPTDDQHIYYSDDIETQYSVELEHDIYQNKIEEEIIFFGCDKNDVMSSISPLHEVISANLDEDLNDEQKIEHNSEYEIARNSSSRSTFRSRTDSSSIGDYESHSSDESDFSEFSDYLLTNKSDFDVNYFNANRIENNSDKSLNRDNIRIHLKKINSNSARTINSTGGENESDIEIDIETVTDYKDQSDKLQLKNSQKKYMSQCNTNNLFMEDDIVNDPSWRPSSNSNYKHKNTISKPKIIHKNLNHQKQRGKGIRNIQSKFSETLKRNQSMNSRINVPHKFGIGRSGKNISMCIQHESSTKSSSSADDEDVKKIDIKSENIREGSNTYNNNTNSIEKKVVSSSSTENSNESFRSVNPVKRKLNLEEYKKRNLLITPKNSQSFEINSLPNNCSESNRKSQPLQEQFKIVEEEVEKKLCNDIIAIENIKNEKKILDPITEAKNKVLRMQELKKKAAQKRLIDFTVSAKVGPVTKILPLEEIVNGTGKSCKNHKKRLNSEYEEIINVSVGCNTDIKIPPNLNNLNSIYGKNYNLSKSTELLYKVSSTMEKVTAIDNLKLSNNSLISSIQNVVFKKTIVDANNKESLAIDHKEIKPINKHHLEEQHGEDKVIMHLPKNRKRKSTYTISTQTTVLPQFPPLELLLNQQRIKKPNKKAKLRTRNETDSDYEEYDDVYDHNYYRARSRSPNTCQNLEANHSYHYLQNVKKGCKNESTVTSSSESDRNRHSRNRNRRIYSKSPSRSERLRSFSSTSESNRSNCSSSSRSSSSSSSSSSPSPSRRRTCSRYDKTLNNRKQERSCIPAVEERRIVYVGRIEPETGKEELKHKFLHYGPIKTITLHYKDTGMKYGFVTFEKPADAFKAIDSGIRDPKINMYDISFGGRRAFCRATYSDLDGVATNTFQSYSSYSLKRQETNTPSQEDSFENLLQKMKEKLSASRVKI